MYELLVSFTLHGEHFICIVICIYCTIKVLILGFGAIGVEIAKRIRPFGVKILATKRNWSAETLPCGELQYLSYFSQFFFLFSSSSNVLPAQI